MVMRKMKDLDALLIDWASLDEQITKLVEFRKERETQIVYLLERTHWKDYTYDKIHVSITDVVVTEIIEDELPLLLNRADLEKVTRRSREKRLIIMTDDKRKRLNKKLRGK